MPYVNIKITREGHVTPEQKLRSSVVSRIFCQQVLHKNPASTCLTN